jgi:hypothetical protein
MNMLIAASPLSTRRRRAPREGRKIPLQTERQKPKGERPGPNEEPTHQGRISGPTAQRHDPDSARGDGSSTASAEVPRASQAIFPHIACSPSP